MDISVFDLFKIGIGPSSSHTIGPMRAAGFLLVKLRKRELFDHVGRIQVELFGSLASTGRGHNTDKAIIWGLLGEKPESIDPEREEALVEEVRSAGQLMLGGAMPLGFDWDRDIVFHPEKQLPHHPNGMRFHVFDDTGAEIFTKDFYSIGGGFIVGNKTARDDRLIKYPVMVRFPFHTAAGLLDVAAASRRSIAQIVFENEKAWRTDEEIREGLDTIHATMTQCIERGFRRRGVLPGRLKVRRRAPALYRKLSRQNEGAFGDPLAVLDWVVLYALAVNEENAAGGRVVTAPTNGAAGIVPAVLRFYERFTRTSSREGVRDYLLTAGAVGLLYKKNASISGAEVGCQGEIGVACSMAAAGLTAVLGGSRSQVENAAEIAMEHNLGLTCDPVDGLVQIPCIERNAMAAVKAINASRIALKGNGRHYVSLDDVIRTMKQTGLDMQSKYKETSQGGLAINITE
ncbi:MAG: L-serine ammonia-lyase, partial [Acidobacteria bacterium]|nr:L-serine ammonia-lyase [Acidobacteriota bacterium]